jgi:hypothetical protein
MNAPSFHENMKKLRANPETKRAGLKWNREEEEQLMEMISEQTSFADIAKKLGRTEGGITTRIASMISHKIENDSASVEDIAEEFKMTVEQVNTIREKEQQKEEKYSNYNKNNFNTNNEPTIKNLYAEIQSLKKIVLSLQRTINKNTGNADKD